MNMEIILVLLRVVIVVACIAGVALIILNEIKYVFEARESIDWESTRDLEDQTLEPMEIVERKTTMYRWPYCYEKYMELEHAIDWREECSKDSFLVTCIDNSYWKCITEGKVYCVHYFCNGGEYLITNDFGTQMAFDKKYFTVNEV